MPSDVAATTHKSKKLPKVLEEIRIKKGKTGGHVLEHHHTHFEHPPETHVFGESEGGKLVAHLQKHMGINLAEPGEQPGEESQA